MNGLPSPSPSPSVRRIAGLAFAGTLAALAFVARAAGAHPRAAHAVAFDERAASWAAIGAGADHVAGGLDHLALVALLVVAARRTRDSLVPLVGFTVAHALTLGFAAFGHPALPIRLAELLVAATLVLATQLRSGESLAMRTGTAFAFGLVHGVAFVEGAAPVLARTANPLRTLAAFHLGIETVQFACAIAVAALFHVADAHGKGAAARTSLGTLAGGYGVALFLARMR